MEQGEARSLPSGKTETNPYLLGETDPAPPGSGEVESIPQPSGETEPALKALGETETSPERSGEAEPPQRRRARRRLTLSPRARQSYLKKASGEAEPQPCHLNKGRNCALVRPEVFNIRWFLVPPSRVPRY